MGIVTVTDETVDITDQPEEVSEGVAPQEAETPPEPAAAVVDEDAPADATDPVESESTEDDAVPSGEEASPAAAEDAEEPQGRHEGMDWYVLRVASNKEEQVRKTLERKVKIEGLDRQIGQILVPTVKEKRMRGRQARVFHRKLYPGYVIVEMATEADGSIPEDIWFMIKETTGVGDFIGSDGKPIKMEEHEVAAILAVTSKSEEDVGLAGMSFKKGDLAKVTEGSFENFEGTIDGVDEGRGMVTVLLTIFGRSTPVEVEYWQVEKL